jgi:valyl-tRNA synthetase
MVNMTDTPLIDSEIPKAYEPGKIERKWYNFWLKQGYFTPEIDPKKKPFVIIMPPPNVTGELHLGHALTTTLEDIMVRWQRMKGQPTLWLPGTDHAGIATQVVVEQQLAGQSLTRKDVGRERFLQMAWKWANDSRRSINLQHQMLGASCDWERERFTLDEGPSRAVRTAFVNLYNKGLIYRGERIINWCPRCQTALSDLEAEHKEISGHLYYIRYPLVDGSGFITVATTRPETFFGDTAVAVNPEDGRYKDLVGKKVMLPIIDKEIPVIADDAVDISLGTGALKITPAHDSTDFEIGQRHNLPLVDIMSPDATLNENAGPYAGLERFACRDKVVDDLREKGLLEKIEPYLHSVGHCIRCQTLVEPRISLQWFIRTKPLAEKAIKVVKDGSITIIPERFTKIYFEWMENIRDWCISRQLWWGHRIPVWYCHDCNELTISVDVPSRCSHCGSNQIVQDNDVLDTWFSSALWTHSTLGWPDDTEDLRYFYPGAVMETGYDILFFWVARMIMMGLENTGKIPFHTVYLHGLIRDEHGEKMSKLRGNVINPAEAVNECGVDALRFALASNSTPGNDMNLGKGKLEASRNFVNKLWNAARFIFQSMDAQVVADSSQLTALRIEDRWIVSRLNNVIDEVNSLMEGFEFGEACWKIHDFIWGEFCDWYVEIAKMRLRDAQQTTSPLPFLVNVLECSLRLLHPFMPFITEELWQNVKEHLPEKKQMSDSIMIAPYPVADRDARDTEAEQAMDSVIEIIRSIRNVRAQYKVEAAKQIEALVYTDKFLPQISAQAEVIEMLARVSPLTIAYRKERESKAGKAVVLVLKESEVILPWAGLVDLSAEEQRLTKESEVTQARIAQLDARLRDNVFLAKAPQHVVEKERQRLTELEDKLERVKTEISQLRS